MPKVNISCGQCGHDLALDFDVPKGSHEEMVRAINEGVAAALGSDGGLVCDRCNSVVSDLRFAELEQGDTAAAAEAMARKINGVRFAVGAPDGPRGAVWRLWIKQSGVYLGVRNVTGEIKVSLHTSGKWRLAFTEQHQNSAHSLIPPDVDRAHEKWERPAEFAPGWVRAFLISVPASELGTPATPQPKPNEIIWVAPPPEGYATHFTVLLAAPGARGSRALGYPTPDGYRLTTKPLTVLDAPGDEKVWVLRHEEPVTPEQVTELEEGRAKVLEHVPLDLEVSDDAYLRAFLYGYQHDRARTRFMLDMDIDAAIRNRPT